MTDWTQLEKDLEAASDLLGPAPHECAEARKRLSDRAPDLAALALAGRMCAVWLEAALECKEWQWLPEQRALAESALAAFRKAEEKADG
jgi:hypothetical protein